MPRPIVWIIKEQVLRGAAGPNIADYSPALKYGDIEFITRCDLPAYPRSSVQEVWNQDVAAFVKKYDEDRDFIVTTGQPIAIFAVGWALGVAGKIPRFLQWRREDNDYRVMNFGGNHAAVTPAASAVA